MTGQCIPRYEVTPPEIDMCTSNGCLHCCSIVCESCAGGSCCALWWWRCGGGGGGGGEEHVVNVPLGCGVVKAGGDDDVGLRRKLQRIVVVGCSDGWCWLRVCGAGDADLQR